MLIKQYAVYIADTGLARNIHHNLRYRVYCERKHYEKPSEVDVPEERDRYDRFATHFLVRNRTSNTWQGTARLITSLRTQLPVQELDALYPESEKMLLNSCAAEVSRLAALSSSCPWSSGSRHLLQATITGLLDYCRQRSIEHLVFLVSPGLARILSRIGIPMQVCGPIVEHRGQRQAFSASVPYAIREIPWARKSLIKKRFCNYFSESVFASAWAEQWAASTRIMTGVAPAL